jgi:hypothetical protein
MTDKAGTSTGRAPTLPTIGSAKPSIIVDPGLGETDYSVLGASILGLEEEQQPEAQQPEPSAPNEGTPEAEPSEDTSSQDTAEGTEELIEESAESEEEGKEEKPAEQKPVQLPEDAVVFTIENDDGTEEPVTLKEAKRGWLRQRDYTLKTMQLAEERKQVEAERATYAQLIDAFAEQLRQIKEPDWEKLKKELPPEQYLLERDAWQQVQAERAALEAERQRLLMLQQQELQLRLQQQQAEEMKRLLEALPHWKDPAVRQREASMLVEFAKQRGFDDQWVSRLTANEVLILRDALLYRQSKTKGAAKLGAVSSTPAQQSVQQSAQQRPSPQPKKPAPLAPGAKQAPASKPSQAAERFMKTGKLRDAAEVFAEEFLRK